MTQTNEPRRPANSGSGGSGYRGALPPRDDGLARPWLIVVAVIFVAIIVLSILGIPSRFVPEPTPVPLPTNPPATESVSPSPSLSPTLEESPSPSPTSS